MSAEPAVQLHLVDDDSPPDELIDTPSKRWIPKKWHPVYEVIVMMHVMGLDNKTIATRYNYTPQQVSNIINTPHAEVIKKLAIERVRHSSLNTIETKLDAVVAKAAERVAAVINDDALFASNPFQVMDRSMKVLESKGYIASDKKPEGNTTNIQNNFIALPNPSLDKLTAALNESDKVKQLNDPNFGRDIGRD